MKNQLFSRLTWLTIVLGFKYSQVVATPVDDFVVLVTTVIQRPEFITVTETKSDFRLAVRTSVTRVTVTHTSYAITNVPFTITATEV